MTGAIVLLMAIILVPAYLYTSWGISPIDMLAWLVETVKELFPKWWWVLGLILYIWRSFIIAKQLEEGPFGLYLEDDPLLKDATFIDRMKVHKLHSISWQLSSIDISLYLIAGLLLYMILN